MSLKPRRVDFNVIWGDLQQTIEGVITLSHVPRPVWNDRFSDVYSLCVAYPESLADRLYAETRQFLINHVARLLHRVQESSESELVRNYWYYWAQYSLGVQYLHNLYLYLNQQHIKTHKLSDAEIIYGSPEATAGDQMEIGELALEVWKTGMIEPLSGRLVKLLLAAIDEDRRQSGTGGSTVNVEAVRGTIWSLVEVQAYKKKGQLTLYQELFEQPFLDTSGLHFTRDAAKLLQERNVSMYMACVIAKIDEELARARKYLHGSSLAKVTARCQQHMVAEHLSFLYSECKEMVVEERKEDLRNMYSLLRSLPNAALHVLVETVLDHIKSQGLQAIGNLQGDNVHIQFVENLLTVYRKYKDQINDVFGGDQNFMGALDKACSSVINHRHPVSQSASTTSANTTTNPAPSKLIQCRSPELLAKYCDTLLKKSSRVASESEIDGKLGQSITIFKYIDDKDVFQKFYARMLAKRLIHQQTQSMDAEEAMINRLKQACGYEFTSKLHRMFTDMSVSADLNLKFNAFLKQTADEESTTNDPSTTTSTTPTTDNSTNSSGSGTSSTSVGSTAGGAVGISAAAANAMNSVNFTIYVLQAGAWPLGQGVITPFCLPQQLERSVQLFETFYHRRFNGRRLTWLHHLCQAELRLGYLRRPHVVTVQTFQMALLLLFEHTDTATCREMQDALQLSADQFQRHLASLVESKLLLLELTESSEEKMAIGSAPSVSTSSSEDSAPTATSTALSSSSSSTSIVAAAAAAAAAAASPPAVIPADAILRLNLDYTNKRTRFRINAAVVRETALTQQQEAEQTVSSVEEDRKLYLQAAIVRIMKSRKILRHNALVQEVCAQSKRSLFAPSIPMIKKCIEALIDKQYIERTVHSTEEYSYVA